MSSRITLEKELCRLNPDQLDAMVFGALKERREMFAMKDDMPSLVFKLMDSLELQNLKLISFLLFLRETTGRPELKDAVQDYLNECLGIQIPQTDPYTDIIVLGQPFVNRQSLREALRLFFNSPVKRIMATKGSRFCGRTHAKYFIQHVCKIEDIECAYADLLLNDIEKIIPELINRLRLPVKEFRDRMGQIAAQSRGFVSAFSAHCLENPNKRFCLIFDHHDLEEVTPLVKEFVELLMLDIIGQGARNVYVIVLGCGSWTVFPPYERGHIFDVSFSPLNKPDVERFIVELNTRNLEGLTPEQIQSRITEVFESLTLPLTLEGMRMMCDRLRNFLN